MHCAMLMLFTTWWSIWFVNMMIIYPSTQIWRLWSPPCHIGPDLLLPGVQHPWQKPTCISTMWQEKRSLLPSGVLFSNPWRRLCNKMVMEMMTMIMRKWRCRWWKRWCCNSFPLIKQISLDLQLINVFIPPPPQVKFKVGGDNSTHSTLQLPTSKFFQFIPTQQFY